MASYNQTQFSLFGFTLNPPLQLCAFVAVLLVYIISLLGNLVIITVTSLDQHLQTPMFFFLRSLATLDIFFISSTVPKLLAILVSGNKAISLYGCLLQLYFYASAGDTEFCTLGLLSLDRYIAICHPLRYSTIMSSQLSWMLAIGSWIFGFLEFMPAVLLMSRLQWCSRYGVIDHFFCDSSALLHLSCSDTYVVETMCFCLASFTILSSFILTLSSYYFILSSIFSISSSDGRSKTFSTCSSHFIAVLIAYGSCIIIYVRPAGTNSSSPKKTVAIFNSILSPFLHPFIYSLRNNVVMHSLKHVFRHSK